MNPKEFRDSLWDIWNQLHREDHALRIEELENSLEYYKNQTKQQEITIIRLETRLAEIRNLLNGRNDKV